MNSSKFTKVYVLHQVSMMSVSVAHRRYRFLWSSILINNYLWYAGERAIADRIKTPIQSHQEWQQQFLTL